MEIALSYAKQRQHFGAPCVFEDSDTDVVSIKGTLTPSASQPAQLSVELDCFPTYCETDVNTRSVSFATQGASNQRGCWPKEVDPARTENVHRFRRKVLKSTAYSTALRRCVHTALAEVKASASVDVFEHYFDTDASPECADPPSATNISVLHDPALSTNLHGTPTSSTPRDRERSSASTWSLHSLSSHPATGHSFQPVTSLCWHQDGLRLLSTHGTKNFDALSGHSEVRAYVWNVDVPHTPLTRLGSSCALTCARYSPRDPNLVGSGMANGLVGLWDTRSPASAVGQSAHEHSHHDPVSAFSWTQSKSGGEAVSTSLDGHLRWWDLRKLSRPIDDIALECVVPSGLMGLGGLSLGYDLTAGVNKVLVGTQQGQVLGCNRKPLHSDERITQQYVGHVAPVYSVQRNPFLSKYFLSVGDWSPRIWVEGVTRPVIVGKQMPHLLTHGVWSPTRAGVFYTVNSAGYLHVWDLHTHGTDPAYAHNIEDLTCHSLAAHPRGGLLAVGDHRGSVTLVRVSSSLASPLSKETTNTFQLLQSESKLEKHLELQSKRQSREHNRRMFSMLPSHNPPAQPHGAGNSPSPANGRWAHMRRRTVLPQPTQVPPIFAGLNLSSLPLRGHPPARLQGVVASMSTSQLEQIERQFLDQVHGVEQSAGISSKDLPTAKYRAQPAYRRSWGARTHTTPTVYDVATSLRASSAAARSTNASSLADEEKQKVLDEHN